MKNETEILEQIQTTLRQMYDLSLLLNRETIASFLFSEIDTVEKRQVYELLDGESSVREISSKTGVSISSISKWSQRWERLGLIIEAQQAGISGRRRKVFNLENYEEMGE